MTDNNQSEIENLLDELSIDDLKEENWRYIINQSKEPLPLDYNVFLENELSKLRSEEDIDKTKIFVLEFIYQINGLHFDPNDPISIYKASFTFSNGRKSFSIENIPSKLLDLLIEEVKNYNNHEIKSRLADIIWLLRKDFTYGKIAVEEYINSAKEILDSDYGSKQVPAFDRIKRALKLSVSFSKKKTGLYEEVVDFIENQLEEEKIKHQKTYFAWLISLLLEHREENFRKYIQIAENAALYFEKNKDWHLARTYWETKAKVHNRKKEFDEANEALTKIAETFLTEIKEILKGEKPSYSQLVWRYQEAIQAYRKIPGTESKREELQIKLIEFQEKTYDEMVPIKHTFSIDTEYKFIRDQIKGLDAINSIERLVYILPSPQFNNLKESAESILNNNVVRSIFPRFIQNKSGKTIAKSSATIHTSDEEVKAQAIREEMIRQTVIHQNVTSQLLLVLLDDLHSRFNYYERDFLNFLVNNPFVPHGRIILFAKGLFAGINFDFVTAEHLLIPQIENSLRYVLFQNKVITSKYDDDGIQDEFSLNKILYLNELKGILGEDLVLDLQSLLIERLGFNQRNVMAHGLEDYYGGHYYNHIYTWWLALRLCFIGKRLSMINNRSETGDN